MLATRNTIQMYFYLNFKRLLMWEWAAMYDSFLNAGYPNQFYRNLDNLHQV